MSAIPNCPPCCTGGGAVCSSGRKMRFVSNLWRNSKAMSRILRLSESDKFNVCRLAPSCYSRAVKDQTISMALVDEKLGSKGDVVSSSSILAYDLIQGALVRWSSVMDRSFPDPPTAVFLHGVLGSRKNWGTFAQRLAQEFLHGSFF